MDAVMQNQCSTTLGNSKVTDLNPASNVAILSEFLEILMAALNTFSRVGSS